VRPTARIQYTGRSFAEMLTDLVLPRFLRPRTRRPPPLGLFPQPSSFAADVDDPVCEKAYEPFFRRCAERFAWLHGLQQGKVHVYLVYIVAVVIAALAWMSARQWWAT
jgi:hypothetical protein